MRTRLSFLAICSLLLSLLTTTTAANSLTANLEVIAVTDSKPGEVELTFFLGLHLNHSPPIKSLQNLNQVLV
jgi:hypothetical protein